MIKYHILNGDTLHEMFPKNIRGEKIIIRECLIDGANPFDSLDSFFGMREKYLFDEHNIPVSWYREKTIPEIRKMIAIPASCEIFLWFEDDLFCQANFWFVVYVLTTRSQDFQIRLVRPNNGNEYNFGKMSSADLMASFQNSLLLKTETLLLIRKLWNSYAKHCFDEMQQVGKMLEPDFPFIHNAVKAHIDRYPPGYGRPEKILKQIINELKTLEFDKIFRAFCSREPIYGFGDLQVRKILKSVLK